jgi:RNA polymerase sigma factor (TIGR02999 family)
MSPGTVDFTHLLRQSRVGDRAAIDEMAALVYKELRRLAGAFFRDKAAGHTLQPTALVHEAYLRLADRSQPDFEDRTHFFNLAAKIMRQILVDHARAKRALKRGGADAKIEFDDSLNYSDEKASDLVALDDALSALAAFDERKARTLELRHFGGLSVEETAAALGVSVTTVGRDTRYAEAFIRRELKRSVEPKRKTAGSNL